MSFEGGQDEEQEDEQDGGPAEDWTARFAACEAAVCGCRGIVERAYRELVGRGLPDRHAQEAATTVLRWHHPELPPPEAQQIVERWVAGDRLH